MERSGMFSATYTSLSTVTKRCLKTKATNLHWTPPLHKHFVSACALLPFFVNVNRFICPCSTELFCETIVAGGQPLHYIFGLHQPLSTLSRGAWGGTLAKALGCGLHVRL